MTSSPNRPDRFLYSASGFMAWRSVLVLGAALAVILLGACRQMVDQTDRQIAAIIAERQRKAMGAGASPVLPVDDELLAGPAAKAYDASPQPVSPEVPADFRGTIEEVGESDAGAVIDPVVAANQPVAEDTAARGPAAEVFTLTDALAYAQRNQRTYQTAKEDLYLAALSLTLERHLWTPIFASSLRTVYGNFGEVRDFDQAMRFVADLSVSQRLPYGGEFTAQAVSTLIRDVGKTITASEGSSIELQLRVPFLRNAGHVAQEDLIQLERDLTYAVRTFERFRRRQLVTVASGYFDLLRAKQVVATDETSLERVAKIFERAREFEAKELGSLLETQRAEQQYLFAENRLENSRESFRAAADNFKLLIGMPVDHPLDLDNLETIESIEAQVAAGDYPLLLRPAAAKDEARALHVAIENRLDLLNRSDQTEDARRGVAIAKNAMLPDLDWTSTVTWDTDPDHYRLTDFSFERTTWRSELLLNLPLERTRERNRYRASLIDVRRAQRNYQESLESISAEVRSAVNQIRLQDRTVVIQRRNLEVADNRVEYARIRYDDGDIEVRELLDAEADWTNAANALNQAKTQRWNRLLQFRLATETLRVDENGVQHAPLEELRAE